MRPSIAFAAWLSLAAAAAMAGHAPTAVVPAIFAPDAIPTSADDGAAAFAPSGATVYFMRATGDEARLGPSHATLYYSAPDHRIHRLTLAPWLARHAGAKP